MIGNLSKSIVKLPNFFLKTLDENYDIENEKTENNLIFQTNNYYKHSNIFREKDYLRFAPLVENLNFNRNRRHILFSKLNSNRKKIDFNDIVKSEEVYTSNLTSSNNNNNININNNKTNSEIFKNNNDLTQTVKTEKFNYESKLIPIQQDEIDNFNNTVRTNIDNLINKIKDDSKRTSFRNSKISINENNNNNENNENNNNENNIENNENNNENKNETFNNNNNSFPKNAFLPFTTKSYDSLFKEMLDEKISSLKLITPKQKKEIFSRNSNFESKSTFDRYKHFYDNYDYNNY